MKGKGAKEYDAKEMGLADLKIIILGDSAVGKSKLVERFLLDDYEERHMSTYALTMYRHNASIDGKSYKIDIWDTAGQECFNTLHPSYYFGAHAAILVFDVTRKVTYLNLKTWYTEMRAQCPDIPCILVANKIDADRSSTEKTFKFAEKFNLPFYFVSAADGTNVVKIFTDCLKLAQQYKLNPPDNFYSEVMDLLNDESLFDKDVVNPTVKSS
jgi:Rab-like protein 2